YQLYSDYGVDTLKPERAHSWEVGVERSLWHASANRSLTLGATWYTRNSDNLIDFAYCPFAGPTPAVCYIPGTTVTRFGYYAN
ncbi:TonB-dependent receptor, partial [Acinetobacter baumannii]